MARIKISLLSLGIMALVNTAYADCATATPCYKGYKGEPAPIQHFNGFYVGVGLGEALNYSKVSSNANVVAIPSSFDEEFINLGNTQSARNWKSSWTGIFDIGWGQQFNESFYLGIEGFVNYAKRNASISNSAGFDYFAPGDVSLVQEATLSTKNETELRNTEYGVDLLPGILLDQTSLLYLRVGVAFNRMELENSNTFSVLYPAVPDTGITTSQLNVEKHKNVSGLRLGIGMEKYICNNMSLSLDYIYTNYGHTSVNGVGNVNGLLTDTGSPTPEATTTLNGFATSAKETMKSNQVYLGLKYRIS